MKKTGYIIAFILLIFFITNPPLSDFKKYDNSNYLGETSEQRWNFLFCSLYTKKYVYHISDGKEKYISKKYIGIVGNFFMLDYKKEK